ncbi:unnamed protein product [Caenorhabditis auriculariae]|uniref:Uncharacterized protein n=1 Tax=Caenorhabditis auriculariae TaxID=2777116 RepID=A0A8S1HRM5_9PELO|nr:unnamed protein product [Caenorhabditis auriculariae]
MPWGPQSLPTPRSCYRGCIARGLVRSNTGVSETPVDDISKSYISHRVFSASGSCIWAMNSTTVLDLLTEISLVEATTPVVTVVKSSLFKSRLVYFINTYVLLAQILFGCSGNILNLVVLLSRTMRSRTNLVNRVHTFSPPWPLLTSFFSSSASSSGSLLHGGAHAFPLVSKHCLTNNSRSAQLVQCHFNLVYDVRYD